MKPRDLPPRDAMDRRRFVSLTGLAALGLVAGCTPAPRVTTPSTAAGEATSAVGATETAAQLPTGWRPIAELSTVAVEADPRADGYPGLSPGVAFEEHSAVAVLARAVGRLRGGSPVDTLRALVPAGATILIKPNWVEPSVWEHGKITHPALVLAMARWAADAVGSSGRVVVAEGTSEGSDLPRILEATGFKRALDEHVKAAAGLDWAPISIVDLNSPAGGRLRVDLGESSRFVSFGDAVYDAHGVRMGLDRVGSYLLAKPIIDADLIVDMAKAKVHSSAGVTLALKNLLGIVPSADGPHGDNSLKDVPHYSGADRADGSRYVGNRTIGRSSADLLAVALHATREGALRRTRQRKVLGVYDGIVSGQRSQFDPDPVGTGWVAAGLDAVAVDHVATRCMGFDPGAVPSLAPAREGALRLGTGNPAQVRVLYGGPGTFASYFGRERALEAENVRADWRDVIGLRVFDAGRPEVTIADGRLTVRTPVVPAAVRVEAAGTYAQLVRTGERAYSIPLPAEGGEMRLVVADADFNLAERMLRR